MPGWREDVQEGRVVNIGEWVIPISIISPVYPIVVPKIDDQLGILY